MNNIQKIKDFLAVFAFVGVLLFCAYIGMKYAIPLIMPFLIAWIFATLINNFTNKAIRVLPTKKEIMSRVILVLFYLFLVLSTLCLFILGFELVSTLIVEIPSYYTETIEPLIQSVYTTILKQRSNSTYQTLINQIYNSMETMIEGFVKNIVKWFGSFVTSVPQFFWRLIIVLIATAFFSIDYDKIKSTISNLIPQKYRKQLNKGLNAVTKTLPQFLKGYSLVLLLTFFESVVFLGILQVKNFIVVALIIALVDILPVLGTGAVVIPWSIYSFITKDYKLGIGLLIMYIFITIVRQYSEPKIIGNKIGVYPIVTLGAMFIGQRLFGIGGLLGFPIIVAIINKEIKEAQLQKNVENIE